MSNEAVISGVKKIVMGAIVCEYGCRQLGGVKQDLKHRVNILLTASNGIQSYYKNNPQADKKAREIFQTEFSKSEIVLLAEIFEILFGVSEDDLEQILTQLQNNIITSA